LLNSHILLSGFSWRNCSGILHSS